MRIVPVIHYFLILLVFTLASCSHDGEKRHAFEVEEIDGVLTAVNTGGSKYSEELFSYEKVLELQQDPDNPESFLNNAESFTMGEDGHFYVQDNGNCRIAVFDRDGIYVRSIGGPGNGPGEFSNYWRLRNIEGNELDLYDYMQQRITIYSCDGTLLDVHTLQLGGAPSSDQFRNPDGSFLLMSQPDEYHDGIRYARARVLTLTSDLDTLWVAETPLVPAAFQFIVSMLGEEMPFWRRMPYASEPMSEYVAGRGIFLSTGVEPALWWYDLKGAFIREIRVGLQPRPVTSDDKQTYRDQLNRQIEEDESKSGGTQLSPTRAILDALEFPENKAHWNSMYVDDAGYIWLRLSESGEERENAGGGWGYYVLNPEGEHLGITRMPARGQIVRKYLHAFVTDPETDEDVPTVWRLIPKATQFKYP